MTVLVFQLEGNDETIQEGLRKIGHTVDGMMKPPSRQLIYKSSDTSTPVPGSDTEVDQSEDLDDADSAAAEQDEMDGESESRRKPSKDRSPELVPLDESQAKIKLSDYCTQKAIGDSVHRRYLVFALWWKDVMGVAEVSMDHIYTCYKTLGWHDFPNKGGQPFREIKSKKEAFEKGSGRGLYKINHIGERIVNTVP